MGMLASKSLIFFASLFGLVLVGVNMSTAQGTFFNQTDFNASSQWSWYGDNWYQLGTGFSGTLNSISVRCFVNDWRGGVGYVWLNEFEDSSYTTQTNSYTLTGVNGNPYCTEQSYDITFSNLNITLNPTSYYRLDTFGEYQNSSVILWGTSGMGVAMWDLFVYGVGEVYYYYTFYPYIISNLPTSPASLGSGGGPQNPVIMYGEPVNTQSGNYFYQHTDLIIPGRGSSVTLSRAYNALASYAGPLGSNWTHNYNVILGDAGQSVSITWGDGHADYYILSAGVYLPPPGLYDALIMNSDGTYLLTRKDRTQYIFSSSGKLTSITDKNGNSIALTYGASGNLAQVTDTMGRVLTLTYDKSNRITTIVDPIGRKESLKYSSANDLVSVTDFLRGVTTFAYDDAHHVTSIILPGRIPLLTNAYDASGRVISQTNADKFTSTFAYNTSAPGQTTVTDPLGNTIVYTYDNSLRIVQVADALNGTIGYGYDANNNRTSVTNQNGKTTTFTYDAMGNVLSTTDPLGDQTSFSYDAKNDLLTSTNANGASTTYSYDGNGNLSTVQDALSHVTKFSYDSFGELAAKTDANNNTTNYGYDSYGDMATITDALSHTTTMGYDGVGRLTSVTDANGNKTTLSYDALGRLIETADALGDATQFKYSLAGNLTKVIDADNNATTYAYDAARNLTSVTDAAKHVTKYAYDANNNRISFTNASAKKTTYTYDKLNRLSIITDPLQFVTAYSYDPVGNVASLTDANGHATQFTYDAANRLTGISYFDGSAVSYVYDADGNRTSMTDHLGTTSYTYDALDRVSGVVQPGGATVAYSYDAMGHRVALNYPDGNAVSYSYDAGNRLSNVTDWLNRSIIYSYDPANRPLGVTYPNTAAIAYAYDSANRLTNITNNYPSSAIGPAGQFSAFTYALDKVGNRTSVTDGNGSTTSYLYDARYELTGTTSPFGATKYTYDAVGNRLTITAPSGTTVYRYDADSRLLSAGKTSFAYDKNGNRISQKAPGQTLTYAYDAANRLASVTGGSQTSTFAYDGDGHRVSQTVGSGTYTYSNDVASALPVVLEENSPDGFIDYNYGLGLISESSSQFDYFYHPDGLGSIIGLTDDSGALQQGYAYDSWGVDTGTQNYVGTANKFRYTGQALDPGTNLYFLRARYYDDALGRFVTKDPLNGIAVKPLTTNRFIYSLNNPITLSDPSGLAPDSNQPNNGFAKSFVTCSVELVLGGVPGCVESLLEGQLQNAGVSLIPSHRIQEDLSILLEPSFFNSATANVKAQIDLETRINVWLFGVTN